MTTQPDKREILGYDNYGRTRRIRVIEQGNFNEYMSLPTTILLCSFALCILQAVKFTSFVAAQMITYFIAAILCGGIAIIRSKGVRRWSEFSFFLGVTIVVEFTQKTSPQNPIVLLLGSWLVVGAVFSYSKLAREKAIWEPFVLSLLLVGINGGFTVFPNLIGKYSLWSSVGLYVFSAVCIVCLGRDSLRYQGYLQEHQ